MREILFLVFVFVLQSFQCGDDNEFATPESILIFSKTQGFRHESIPYGTKALEKLFIDNGYLVTLTEDASLFNESALNEFSAFIFFQTTGDVLTNEQQTAFENILRRGRGFVGIHSASDTETDWPFYGKLVGAYFDDHPPIQKNTVINEDPPHPINQHIPAKWVRTDECYNFKSLPQDVHVLLSLDETTYSGGKHGDFHPISWCHEWQGIKSFYTGLGHGEEHYDNPLFLNHILRGLEWTITR